jgi:hypothetical protein
MNYSWAECTRLVAVWGMAYVSCSDMNYNK